MSIAAFFDYDTRHFPSGVLLHAFLLRSSSSEVLSDLLRVRLTVQEALASLVSYSSSGLVLAVLRDARKPLHR